MTEKPIKTHDPALTMPRQKAADSLATQIEKGVMLAERTVGNNLELDAYRQDVTTWNDDNADLLHRMISSKFESSRYAEYTGGFSILPDFRSYQEEYKRLNDDVSIKIHRLQSLLERLNLFPELAK
jgi:hypothetical protein